MDEDEIEWRCDDAHCRVGLTRKVAKVFARLDAQIRAQLLRWMGIYAREAGANIPQEKFKFERRIAIGKKEIPVYVFKAWQTRLYGGYLEDAASAAFLITEIDDAKKQNKADPACIERAARVLAQLIAAAGGGERKK